VRMARHRSHFTSGLLYANLYQRVPRYSYILRGRNLAGAAALPLQLVRLQWQVHIASALLLYLGD
jgi:hypothetical protein